MQPKYLGIIIVVLAIIVGGYFLFRENYQAPAPTVTPEKTEGPTEIPSTTKIPTSEITEINVIGTEFSFNPSSIGVKAGEQVKITFTNTGKASHNLVLEKLGIATKTIDKGKTDVVEFTAPSSGTYGFFCSVPGHRASGMEGSLKVE